MNCSLIPKNLDDFIINRDIALSLKGITVDNITNILIYGRLNTGRKTLMYAFLNYINNCDVYKLRTLNSAELKIGNNKVNIDYISTPYHIEINLYEYGLYDKNIINDFLIEHIKYKVINNIQYKFIVINHFDYISKESQVSLKLLLDKCHDNVRFIFIANNITKIENSIMSRISSIRIPVQKKEVIKKYVDHISNTQYKISQVHRKLIIQQSNSDLFLINNAIICFHYNKKLEFSQIDSIEKYINEIVVLINTPDLKSVLKIRQVCYNLLLINITVPEILKKIYRKFLDSNKISEKIKMNIINIIVGIEARMCYIEHDLICLEFFALKVKKLLISN